MAPQHGRDSSGREGPSRDATRVAQRFTGPRSHASHLERNAMDPSYRSSCFVLALVLSLAAGPVAAQVSIPSLGVPVTQDFNTLASAGSSGVMPPGWAFSESGPGANASYSAGNGNSNAGDSYSFGAAGSSERALGTVLSGNQNLVFGGSFVNSTGNPIASLTVSYTGEQWRLGNAGRADRIDFQYSLNAVSLTTGTWTNVDALDFSSPNITTLGALDGNAAGNRTTITGVISGLAIPPGSTVWIRWNDFNAQGSDDGLAADDLSVTASGVLTPAHPTTWGKVKTTYR
jgi:hypothetical protein